MDGTTFFHLSGTNANGHHDLAAVRALQREYEVRTSAKNKERRGGPDENGDGDEDDEEYLDDDDEESEEEESDDDDDDEDYEDDDQDLAFWLGPNDANRIFRAVLDEEMSHCYRLSAIVPMISRRNWAYDVDVDSFTRTSHILSDVWDKHQATSIVEGVVILDGHMQQDFRDAFRDQIDALRTLHEQEGRLDYHPHSRDVVLDLVHPALFAYVKDTTPLRANVDEVKPCIFSLSGDTRDGAPGKSEGGEPNTTAALPSTTATTNRDFWGRKYESSVHQWLPTYFSITTDGRCTIDDYINNLVPREKHSDLYDSIARLFESALPFIESVYTYVRAIQPYLQNDQHSFSNTDSLSRDIDLSAVSLRGQKLQVITKIVDYELRPGQQYSGVWHVEGMSHEEIVCTALYVLGRDETIDGGSLEFKRAFFKDEVQRCVFNISQSRHIEQERKVREGIKPLGTVETRNGRLIVFPNSHVHRVQTMTNLAKEGLAKRRIVVFFVVNPLKRIVSTREVAPQQYYAGGSVSMEEAKKRRLELMKERKYTKQDWNVRQVELCEH